MQITTAFPKYRVVMQRKVRHDTPTIRFHQVDSENYRPQADHQIDCIGHIRRSIDKRYSVPEKGIAVGNKPSGG